jgi:putative DNA primase/helicase
LPNRAPSEVETASTLTGAEGYTLLHNSAFVYKDATTRPPRPPEPIWDAIPDELISGRHCGGWRYELVNDRWTKRPRKSDGSWASSTDPATWSSFTDIQDAYYSTSDGRAPLDGFGIFLHQQIDACLHKPFIGWDFDHCVDPATGNITDPLVAAWISLFASYTEYSPSHAGLRCFTFGKLPDLHRRLGTYECYSENRFISVTGNIFGEARAIRECQAEIDLVHSQIFAERIAKRARVNNCGSASTASISLSDADLLDRARRARNGDKFADLYDRADISSYASHSEADLSLCSRLYFWCGGDAERIARLWRSSALAREKLFNRGDYVARTIDAVLANGGPIHTSGYNMAGNGAGNNGASGGGGGGGNQQNGGNIRRASIRLSTVQPKQIQWLWPDVLPYGMVSAGIADPGVGKSIFVRDLAARITTGHTLPGGFPCEKGSVIFVDDENGIGDTIRPSIDTQGGDPSKIFIFKLRRDSDSAEIQFDLGKHLPALRDEILEHGDTKLVIIDPPTSYLGDADESKNAQVRAILTPLKPLAEETNVAILMLLHFNKAATMDILYRVSGSLAFIELPRITWAFVVDPEDSNRRLMLLHMTNITAKDVRGYAFTVGPNADKRVQLTWCDDPPDMQLRDVMAGFSNTKRGPHTSKREQLTEWLLEVLGDFEEHRERDIKKAAELKGFSDATYTRARWQLKNKGLLRSRPEGFGADKQWWIQLIQNS